MSFVTKAVGLVNKMKNNLNQTDGGSPVSSGLSVLSKMSKAKLIMIFTPIFCIGVVLLAVTVSYASDLEQVQMNDPNQGLDSSGGAVSGTGIYTESDFEDAVRVSNSASIANSVSEFASHLSGTKYGNLSGFNDSIKANTSKAGWGTREGIVAAAMTLAYEYPKATGYKLFYQLPGTRDPHDGVVDGKTYLDCRGFVFWALYNGGFNDVDILQYRTTFESWGNNNGIASSDTRNAKPGDIFSGPCGVAHIWLIIGNYDGGYYVAEEFGRMNGLVVNKYSYEQHDAAVSKYCAKYYDMSSYYSNLANIRSR